MYKITQTANKDLDNTWNCGNTEAGRIARDSKLIESRSDYSNAGIYDGQNLSGLYFEEQDGFYFLLAKL